MSGRIEDYIAEIESDNIDPHAKWRRLKESKQYQNLQKELAESKDQRLSEVDTKADVHGALKKNGMKPLPFKLKPSFKWKKDEKGEDLIDPHLKKEEPVLQKIKEARSKILHFLGYKIDITERLEEFIESYQKHFIESRASNFFLGKYSQLKFGMLQKILGLLGLSSKTMQSLQKKALKGAREENKRLFAQNEYNTELMALFGSGKKDKGRRKILQQTSDQLIKKMEMLGDEAYYTKDKINEIKHVEVNRILRELIREKQTLEYLLAFRG